MHALDPELRRRVAATRVARLATVRPDATPHVVPITFALMGRSIVTAVDDKPKRTTTLQRLRNIAANPAVSVLIDHYDDDWDQLWWARADGTATTRETETAPDALDVLAAKHEAYRNRRPQGPVIVVAVDRWSAWSASGPENKRQSPLTSSTPARYTTPLQWLCARLPGGTVHSALAGPSGRGRTRRCALVAGGCDGRSYPPPGVS